MATNLVRLSQSRFAVERTGTVCSVKGVLLADTKLELYSDLFSNIDTVTLDDLVFVSWPGAERFFSFLSNLGRSVSIENVGTLFFEVFALQGASFPSVVLGNVQLSICKKSRLGVNEFGRVTQDPTDPLLDTTEVNISQLLKDNRVNDFVLLDNVFVGSLIHILGPYIRSHDGEILIRTLEEKVHPSQDFFFLFLCFLNSLARLTTNQLQAIACVCYQRCIEIVKRLENINKGLTLLGLDNTDLPGTQNLLTNLEQGFDSVLQLLEQMNAKMLLWILEKKDSSITSELTCEENQLLAQRLAELRSIMVEFGKCSDVVGASSAELLMPLCCGSTVFSRMETLATPPTEAAVLTQVSELFYVVDVFAADHWEMLLPEVKAELDLLDTMVMNLVVELQGFDSAKQVIEKRALEINHLLEQWTQTPPLSPEQSQASLLDVISGKLVTVHERAVYTALFGAIKAIEQTLVETQDVSFFF